MNLSKINFTYKNNIVNSQKYLLTKQLQTQQRIHVNDTKSIQKTMDLTNSADTNKIQDIDTIFKDVSDQKVSVTQNDTNIEIKIYDTSSISTNLIDNIVEDEIIITEEQKDVLQKKVYYDIGKNNENSLSNNVDINENLFDLQFIDSTLLKNDSNIIPFNVERIKKRGIRIINNVYQSKYNYGKSNCTGLGDFIRGCYFIMEFCDKYQFQPKIIFNNSISKFLQVKTHKLELIQNVLQAIDFFKNNNFTSYNIKNDIILEPIKNKQHIMADFVDYIVQSPHYYGNTFLFCNSYPLENISEKNKEYMRKILEPTIEMKNMVQSVLSELHFKYKEFIVIHIRSGDSYLKNENQLFSVKYIENLTSMIHNDISNISKNNFLIIADNNPIKIALKKVFPSFKILLKHITHFGEGIVLEDEKVKNSLIDFYLLSFSKAILSYSCYEHGSGFSYWCAKTYNVPYICKFVK